MVTHNLYRSNLSPCIARLDPLRVSEHSLHAVRRDPHRPRELRGQQPQHPEEGALQEEDVAQGCAELAGGGHQVHCKAKLITLSFFFLFSSPTHS